MGWGSCRRHHARAVASISLLASSDFLSVQGGFILEVEMVSWYEIYVVEQATVHLTHVYKAPQMWLAGRMLSGVMPGGVKECHIVQGQFRSMNHGRKARYGSDELLISRAANHVCRTPMIGRLMLRKPIVRCSAVTNQPAGQ